MSFQLEGKLHRVFDTEQKTESFQAREFVIETIDTQYPQVIKFQLTQDKCALIDNYSVGDQLTVHFDLRGREWNEKFFTNLNAWKIEQGDSSEGGSGGGTGKSSGQSQAGSAPATGATADFDDDIPF
ncbi:MAG: DUF3127 domain-containing protein [Gammaproteobacteria bacterium]|nr:DUF3127 domain-containing protein [Gammaproteobacteria bacterium]